MINVETEFPLQVQDAGSLIYRIEGTVLLYEASSMQTNEHTMPLTPHQVVAEVPTPNVLVAAMFLSGDDEEPVFVYFDATRGFAFLKDRQCYLNLFDSEEEDTDYIKSSSCVRRIQGFSRIDGFFSSSFYSSLSGLLQSTPKGTAAFGNSLASVLSALAKEQSQ